MLVRRVSAKDARNDFSNLLGLVYYSKEAVVVEKRGRPVAVMINPDDYERLLKAREERFAVLDQMWAKNPDVTPEQAEADAAREIAAVRAEKDVNRKGRGD
jgi:prevent-host-death family protein